MMECYIVRAIMRWVISAFYVAAGVAHLAIPEQLTKITPSWVPYAPQVIFLTGVFEFVVSIALVTRPFRHWAGIAMAVYAVCVWPANFKHAIDGVDLPYISDGYLSQPPFDATAAYRVVGLYCSEVVDWPWRRQI